MYNTSNYWQSVFRHRLTRRRLLRASAAGGIGLAAAAALGCGEEEARPAAGTPTATATAAGTAAPTGTATPSAQNIPGAGQTPKYGGTLREFHGTVRTLDLHKSTFLDAPLVWNNVSNGLLKFDFDSLNIEKDLASSWEQPDATTVVFKLPQGVKMHNKPPVNGREVVAEDVKLSFERQATNQPGTFQHAYFFLGWVQSIETPDNYTVTIKTTKPFAPLISYIASPWSMIIPHESWELDPDYTRTEAFFGMGPFMAEKIEKGVEISFVKNPDYWKKDAQGNKLPYIDRIVTTPNIDPNTALAAFLAGDIDATGISFEFREEVQQKKPNAHYLRRISQFPRVFRTQPYDDTHPHNPPYNDVRVRRAIAHAIQPEQILSLVYRGDGIVVYGPIMPERGAWSYTKDVYPYDISKAMQLLKEAGYENGFNDTMISAGAGGGATIQQELEILKEQLALVNINAEINLMETAQYYNRVYDYNYTLAVHTILQNQDPDEALRSYFGEPATYFRWGNKEIWRMIDEQASEIVVEERVKKVQAVQDKILEDSPWVWLRTQYLHLFTQPHVKGWHYPWDSYDNRRETVWLDRA